MKLTQEMEWLRKFGNPTADKIMEHLANYVILQEEVENYAKLMNITTEQLFNEQRLAEIDIDTAIDRLEAYTKSIGADIYSDDRRQVNVLPKYCFYYVLRKYTNLSLNEIADFFSRDHSTVVHGERRVSGLIGRDEKVTEMVKKMTAIIFDEAEIEAEIPEEDMTGWVTVIFAADKLGLSPDTIRLWIRQNRIKAIKRNGPMLVRMEQVEHYAATKTSEQQDYRIGYLPKTRNTPRRAVKVSY